jgi:hypothetical protein
MPAIVGELCAGVLLGPSVLEQLSPGISHWLLPRETGQFHMLDATAQLGVLLLVALTGIHMDLSLIRRRRSAILRISVLGLVVPLALGVGAGLLLPDSLVPDAADRTTFALFLGIVMGVSAIPVIAKTLMDLRLLHRNIGQLTLCAVMVDDMVGWLLLSVVSAMATTGIRAGNITVSLAWPLVVVLAAVVLRPVLRHRWAADGHQRARPAERIADRARRARRRRSRQVHRSLCRGTTQWAEPLGGTRARRGHELARRHRSRHRDCRAAARRAWPRDVYDRCLGRDRYLADGSACPARDDVARRAHRRRATA